MTGIYFFAQLSAGAGIGAIATGVTTLLSLYIVIASLKLGDLFIKPVDWFCLIVSLVSLIIWYFAKTPVYTVILIIISDIAAVIPTLRKTFNHPYTETMATYALAILKHILVICSIGSVTFASAGYTFYLIIMNTVFVSMLISRRRVIKPKN